MKNLVFILATIMMVHSAVDRPNGYSLDELLREVARHYDHINDERGSTETELGDALTINTRFDSGEENDDDFDEDVTEEGIPLETPEGEEEEEIPTDAVERELFEMFETREFENGTSGTMRRRGVAEPFTTWAVDPDIWGPDLNMNSARPGSASNDDDCHKVSSVPSELRSNDFYKPVGSFYQKYTHAYKIPILGSNDVSDEGLMRACYVIKFMLADRYDMRNVFYKFWGRIALIGDNEQVTDLPDYSHLDSGYWDARARGLGATLGIPTASAGDDNMKCADNDRYWNQDILVHEFAHGVHTMAAQYVIPGFAAKLKKAYDDAMDAGKWEGTYAASNFREYWAMANQMYLHSYNGNQYEVTVNGETKYMRDRETLALYDPTVKELIDQLYPCQNTFVHRCDYKECTLANFQEKVNNDYKRSGCPVIKTDWNTASLEECASYTCSKNGNAFNYRNTYCYALDCAGSSVELEDHAVQHYVYKLDSAPEMNQLEQSTPMDFNCAPKQKDGPDGSDRCSARTDDICGDSESKSSCKDKGCCWKSGTCYFPKQDCRDEGLNCPNKAVQGKCSSNKDRCPLSCGNDQCK